METESGTDSRRVGVVVGPTLRYWVLRETPEAPAGDTKTRPEPEKVSEEPAELACARCFEPITSDAEWLEVGGAREHSFMNPHGFYYRIGCFGNARALEAEGGWSDEWSWFPPCAWQVQRCARCGEHLGWLFRGPERRFFGLILDRLVRSS
jgi:hypothetical protein